MIDQPLPPGWAWTTLEKITEVVRGATYKKSNSSDVATAGMVPLVRATNIQETLNVASGLIYVPSDCVSGKQMLRVNDIVIATSSGSISVIGKSAALVSDWNGTFGAFCAVLRPQSAVTPKYLALLVKSDQIRKRWSSLARGTNINNLKRGDLVETPIPLPPLPEQRRIVEVLEDHLSRLDAADASVSIALRRVEALDAAIRSVSVTVKPDSSSLPPGWKWQTLDDLSSGSSYGTSTKCDASADGTPVIRIPNIKSGQLDFREMKHAVDRDLDLSSLYLGPGDLLFVRTNGSPALIGRTAVVRESAEMAFASYLIRFRLDSIEMADWVQLVLSTQPWRHQIMKAAASSAGQYNLNQKFLKSLRIPVPPHSSRQTILNAAANGADDVRRLSQTAPTISARSAALRRSLLRAAFNGELVDQDPTDEPADVALARIRDQRSSTPTRRGRRTAAAQ